MILEHIRFTQFRNFSGKDFSFDPHLTIIVGENAKGKTNLLEGVFVSMNGVGFRETKEEELILWDNEQAVVETLWRDKESTLLFQIMLLKKGDKVEKRFFVNKSSKTHNQYLDYTTKAVLFAPDHMDIITGSPDKRRDYLNKVLSLIDQVYKKKLHNYETALRKRNKVLEIYKSETALEQELLFWNSYLEEQAKYITSKREEYMNTLNEQISLTDRVLKIVYVKNEFTSERLTRAFDLEKKIRRTIIGPQKDDFQVFLIGEKKKNIHLFGSRSEQRLAVFWLKLFEIYLVESTYKKKPVLLLDDVFSELDTNNKKLVLDLIQNYQTIITTTEIELAGLSQLPQSLIQF